MDDVVILSAVRTPIGVFQGALASLPAHTLGSRAIAGDAPSINIGDRVLGNPPLLIRGVEDCRTVAQADVIPLPVLRGGVGWKFSDKSGRCH